MPKIKIAKNILPAKATTSGSVFTYRRKRNAMITLIIILLLAMIVHFQHQQLVRSNFTTGYVLISCLFFLAAFNLRKKIPVLPGIGSAAFWMQVHIYVGLATFAIFGLHVAWRIPNGSFELFLTFLYLSVAGSGVYGLYATRVLPRRLTAIPEEVIFETIPWLRNQLALQARSLVVSACESTDVLAQFYTHRLSHYLERPRGVWYLLNPNGRMRRQMIAEIEELDRFLATEQRPAGRELVKLVQQKDDLDYHAAIQGRLKVWLFVHIGLTYSLLAVAVLHGVLVHAFSGGFQ